MIYVFEWHYISLGSRVNSKSTLIPYHGRKHLPGLLLTEMVNNITISWKAQAVKANRGRAFVIEEVLMPKREDYLAQLDEWGYGYCRKCGKIRYSADLEATENGIRCRRCGSYDLEAPGWIYCPHEKASAVKCARAGRGIKQGEFGSECELRCNFRKS